MGLGTGPSYSSGRPAPQPATDEGAQGSGWERLRVCSPDRSGLWLHGLPRAREGRCSGTCLGK